MPRKKYSSRKFIDPRPCEFCGTIFMPNRFFGKYCSEECKREAFYARRGANLRHKPAGPLALNPDDRHHWSQDVFPSYGYNTKERYDEATEALVKKKSTLGIAALGLGYGSAEDAPPIEPTSEPNTNPELEELFKDFDQKPDNEPPRPAYLKKPKSKKEESPGWPDEEPTIDDL